MHRQSGSLKALVGACKAPLARLREDGLTALLPRTITSISFDNVQDSLQGNPGTSYDNYERDHADHKVAHAQQIYGRHGEQLIKWANTKERPWRTFEYNVLIKMIGNRRGSHMIRDVWDEMYANGVTPNFDTYYLSIFHSMKARRLEDTLFFYDNMKKAGIEPDVATYTAVISACGKTGHLSKALELLDIMAEKNMEPTKNTYLAMLNALAEVGDVKATVRMFDEMRAKGHEASEFAFCALINVYKRVKRPMLEIRKAVLDLVERSTHESKPEALLGRPTDRYDENIMAISKPGLITKSAALSTLMIVGDHEAVLELYADLMSEHSLPTQQTDAINCIMVRSHLHDAMGVHRMNNAGVLAPPPPDQHPLRAEASMEKDPRPALMSAFRGDPYRLSKERDVAKEEQSDDDEDWFDFDPLTDSASEAAAGPADTFVAGDDRVLTPSQRARLAVMEANSSYESWKKAVVMWAQMHPDGAQRWPTEYAPDLWFEYMMAGLQMQQLGHEAGSHIAIQALGNMEEHGMFVNVSFGTTLLNEACLPEVWDLTYAHALWDHMLRGASQRLPLLPAVKAYQVALLSRAPHMTDRLVEVDRILGANLSMQPPGDGARHPLMKGRNEYYQRV